MNNSKATQKHLITIEICRHLSTSKRTFSTGVCKLLYILSYIL